jgi:hypothetical protein
MDYRIRRSPAELNSTGFVEIGPGRYSGAHWQEGCLFIWGDAFGMAEGLISKHLSSYDSLEMNDVPEEIGRLVIADWRAAAAALPSLRMQEAFEALRLADSYHLIDGLENELQLERWTIAAMLNELAQECEIFYALEPWIRILGR